jgi:hypothetical protein
MASQQRRQEPVKISKVEYTEPEQEGDVYKTRIAALVSRGQRPVADENVVFSVNLIREGGSEPTDDTGRAHKDLSGLRHGRYTLEAQIEGTSIKSAPVTMTVGTPDKPLGVDKLRVRGVGEGGECTLLIDVSDENGGPLRGGVVEITDLEKTAPGLFGPVCPDLWNMTAVNPYRVYLKTDEHGFASCNVSFGDYLHSYAVRVGNIRETVTLTGRSRFEASPEPNVPEYLPSGPVLGIFGAIARGFRDGRDQTKRRREER